MIEFIMEFMVAFGRIAEVAMPLLAVFVTIGWVMMQATDWYLGPPETRPSRMGIEFDPETHDS